jgi:ubiquinone/menaquinone biosynthesis C-methylase UbiE
VSTPQRPEDSAKGYLHGYDTDEQRRLVAQARYWARTLITPRLEYKPFDRVLDIGCGVGAVLGVLHGAFKGLRLAGIDRESRQIDFARVHLASQGATDPDLRVGDAAALPWASNTFDHVYMMWFIEHLPREVAPRVLREALRVLKPGGTISINETDYTTFKVYPGSPDWDHLEAAQHEHFARSGEPIAGRKLGPLLVSAGFVGVEVVPMGFHFFRAGPEQTALLRDHAEYLAGFLEPAIPPLSRLGYDAQKLARGVAHLRSLPERDEASLTNIVYRGSARKPESLR